MSSTNLTYLREIERLRTENAELRQANKLQDIQLANSCHAFKLADAKRAMAETENVRLRAQVAALEQQKGAEQIAS